MIDDTREKLPKLPPLPRLPPLPALPPLPRLALLPRLPALPPLRPIPPLGQRMRLWGEPLTSVDAGPREVLAQPNDAVAGPYRSPS